MVAGGRECEAAPPPRELRGAVLGAQLIMSGNPEAAKGDKDELVTLYQARLCSATGNESATECAARGRVRCLRQDLLVVASHALPACRRR